MAAITESISTLPSKDITSLSGSTSQLNFSVCNRDFSCKEACSLANPTYLGSNSIHNASILSTFAPAYKN